MKMSFEVRQPMFTGVPAEIALAMFEELMAQQELIERGERCDKCGELHLPEDLSQGLCDDCLMDLVEEMVDELVDSMIMDIIEEVVEEVRREEEEKELEQLANFLSLIDLLTDETPIDMRLF